MPTTPIHADHIQPSEAPWLLEVLRTTHVAFSQPGTTVVQRLGSFIVPCDGIIANPRMLRQTEGDTSGTTSVDLQIAGSSILDATMDATQAAASDVETAGTFTAAADAEVTRNQRIDVECTALETSAGVGLHVSFDFIALGRAA